MEEIIDLEEIEKDITPENLKEFMKKDEETEKLLNEKIEEISKEEEKLNNKEAEIKSLEDSNREKISTNASADELIEIAGKIKEAESELISIKENVDKLLKEKEELIKTKESFETSKKEYIKTLSETSSTYEVQLNKINEAINVCDNPTLKQVLEDVQSKMNAELSELQEKRLNELKTVLKEEVEEEIPQAPVLDVPSINEPVETKEEISLDSVLVEPTPIVEETNINVELPSKEEIKEEVKDENIISLDSILTNQNDIPEVPVLDSFDINTDIKQDIPVSVEKPIIDELPKEENIPNETSSDILSLDAILSTPQTEDLNVVKTDNIVVPEVNQVDIQNENKIKIIYEKDVPDVLLKEIYTSSKIMPSLYDFLNNKNEGSFI